MHGRPDRQREAPLVAAVDRFFERPDATFTTPGHKRAAWLTDPLLDLDLPLASGADDAQLSHDYLGEAERLAARAVVGRLLPLLGQRLDARQRGVRARGGRAG